MADSVGTVKPSVIRQASSFFHLAEVCVSTSYHVHSQPPPIHDMQTCPLSLKVTDAGAQTWVCPDASPCCPSLRLAGPEGGCPAWWVKPKILRIPHNITAMLRRVSAACYGGCRAWLLEGIFSFRVNAWHPQTVNRSLGRNRWNYLLTLSVMKMISQLTLLIYSILWEDRMSASEVSLQIVSKRTPPLAFRMIYAELWQLCRLWGFPFMFTFVHFSLAVSDDRQISAATYNLISLAGEHSDWGDFLQPQLPPVQQAEGTVLVNIFKGKVAAKISHDDITGIAEKKPRSKKFITWDRFN